MKISGKLLLALLCHCSIVLYSCKKTVGEYPTPSTPPPAPRVKAIDFHDNSSERFYYNEMWRVSAIIYTHNGKDYEKITYQYSDSSVVLNDYDSTGKLTDIITYKLNADKLAILRTSTQSSLTHYFAYNNNKQLVFDSTIDSKQDIKSRFLYYYSNGNADSTDYTVTGNNSIVFRSINYYDSYFVDKLNTTSNPSFGISFFGIPSVNPLKSFRYIPSLGEHTASSFEYEYDQQNRIIKRTATNTANGTQSVETFTYY